jgi:K+-transporting ATPase KdpC subunit
MRTLIRPVVVLFIVLSLLVGVVYPFAVTGIARVVFPQQAAGSLVERDGKVVGSLLIGQHFSDPKYFWGRPSATSPGPNNAAGSSGSNLGPSNPALRDAVKERVAALRAADGQHRAGSVDRHRIDGLDPDISLAAAEYQVARIALHFSPRAGARARRRARAPAPGFAFSASRASILNQPGTRRPNIGAETRRVRQCWSMRRLRGWEPTRRLPDRFDQRDLEDPTASSLVALRDAGEGRARQNHGGSACDLAVGRAPRARGKIEEYGDTLFASCTTVGCRRPTSSSSAGRRLRRPELYLGAQSRRSKGPSLYARAEREPHLLRHGSGFVFYALLDAVVDRYFPVIDALETDLEAIEDKIFEPHLGRANIERLYALKRKIGVVKHAVAPLQEAVAKLVSGRVPQVCSNNREYFRDVFDHLTP